MLKMPNMEKVEKRQYIMIETDATGIDWETSEGNNLEDTLTPSEWETLEALFAKHPMLIKIGAPYRDPKIKGKMNQ